MGPLHLVNWVLGLFAVLCTGAGGSQKLPPPGIAAGLVGSTGGGGENHPFNITIDDASSTNEKMAIATGSRHQGIGHLDGADESAADMPLF